MTFFVILVLFLPAGWKIDPQQNLVDKSLFESSGFGRSLADVSTAKQIRQERAREDPATDESIAEEARYPNRGPTAYDENDDPTPGRCPSTLGREATSRCRKFNGSTITDQHTCENTYVTRECVRTGIGARTICYWDGAACRLDEPKSDYFACCIESSGSWATPTTLVGDGPEGQLETQKEVGKLGEVRCLGAPTPSPTPGGWYLADRDTSCTEACTSHNLMCSEQALFDHNHEVDSGEKLKQLIIDLGYTGPSLTKSSGAYGTTGGVPQFDDLGSRKGRMLHSSSGRSLATFDCSSGPGNTGKGKRRVCYCTSPTPPLRDYSECQDFEVVLRRLTQVSHQAQQDWRFNTSGSPSPTGQRQGDADWLTLLVYRKDTRQWHTACGLDFSDAAATSACQKMGKHSGRVVPNLFSETQLPPVYGPGYLYNTGSPHVMDSIYLGSCRTGEAIGQCTERPSLYDGADPADSCEINAVESCEKCVEGTAVGLQVECTGGEWNSEYINMINTACPLKLCNENCYSNSSAWPLKCAGESCNGCDECSYTVTNAALAVPPGDPPPMPPYY